MPHRLVSVAILVGWALASVALFRRDILPDLLIGPPPDLRTVARAEGQEPGPTRWSILVADEDDELRAVGQVQTEARWTRDGWCRLASLAWFDAGALLKGTPLAISGRDEPIEVRSAFDVDKSGNLDSFRTLVRVRGTKDDLVVLTGGVRGNDLTIHASAPMIPMLNWVRKLPYQPREMVQNELGPIDRMPGLRVGQRWESRVISPLTGRVERVQVSVERTKVITWDGNPVTTLEVVTRMPPWTARSWVQPDGLVLRQEVPLPLVKLILERLPDRFLGPDVKRIDDP
jgi:hypothetical protein